MIADLEMVALITSVESWPGLDLVDRREEVDMFARKVC